MYDHLYSIFDEHGVEVVVHADHPTLNRKVAEMLTAGERIDLLSTHSKYAPSQANWLRPLNSLIDHSAIHELAPLAVDLCRYHGQLLTFHASLMYALCGFVRTESPQHQLLGTI